MVVVAAAAAAAEGTSLQAQANLLGNWLRASCTRLPKRSPPLPRATMALPARIRTSSNSSIREEGEEVLLVKLWVV
jgi:hypothetical protein